MKTSYDIIVRPINTERAYANAAERKYTFEVLKNVNKHQIKDAIEEAFGVTVEKVYTMNVRGKRKRQGRSEGYTRSWKKAIVKLTQDSKTIEFFEGI
ncbi:MAG: 50S ribosomal protein L23 [Bacillota bacterium]|nr:50S ribosomal protein L23 [Bacillota bacterium]